MTSRPPLATANKAASRARNIRAEWLTGIHMGLFAPADVIKAACEPDGAPLRRITLMRLLTEQDGWGRGKATSALERTLRLLDMDPANHRVNTLTIQWLIDARAGGRRVHALADALNTNAETPWEGFPYAPQPTQHSNRGKH